VVSPVRPGRSFFLVLACPAQGLSTAAVYRGVTVPDRPESGAELRTAFERGDVEELGPRLHNRLQPVAEGLCPEVARVRQRLAALGPAGAMMSGSGTSVFAVCRDRAEAVRVARAVPEAPADRAPAASGGGVNLFVVRSCV
jgi:4-diphosphocytidyl-2-C-methyl-D-erythritol kinase